MYIAITNFVFPVLFSLVQIIIVYREVNLIVVNDVVLVNTSIAVIGVVFATVWAGSGKRPTKDMSGLTGNASPNAKGSGASPVTAPALSTIMFESRHAQSQGTGTDSRGRDEVWSGHALEEGRVSPTSEK